MQQYSDLRDPRHPRPWFRRIEVNMPWQPCHQQRRRAPGRSTRSISSQDARNREPASRHHAQVGDLLLQAPLQAKPVRVLPQYDERSRSTSLDSQPIHGGADATGHSAMANDATALAHRRRNPGESLRAGPTLPEPAIPPVAVGHVREAILQEPAAIGVFYPPEAVIWLLAVTSRAWTRSELVASRARGSSCPGSRPAAGRAGCHRGCMPPGRLALSADHRSSGPRSSGKARHR